MALEQSSNSFNERFSEDKDLADFSLGADSSIFPVDGRGFNGLHFLNLFDQPEDEAGERHDLATGNPYDNSTYTGLEGLIEIDDLGVWAADSYALDDEFDSVQLDLKEEIDAALDKATDQWLAEASLRLTVQRPTEAENETPVSDTI